MKTDELTGTALDWAVALAEGHRPPLLRVLRGNVALPQENDPMWVDYLDYSTDWAQGGPIIERERIDTYFDICWQIDPNDPEDNGERWYASKAGPDDTGFYGPTPLIAAMRCYVQAKLGDEVEIPQELL